MVAYEVVCAFPVRQPDSTRPAIGPQVEHSSDSRVRITVGGRSFCGLLRHEIWISVEQQHRRSLLQSLSRVVTGAQQVGLPRLQAAEGCMHASMHASNHAFPRCFRSLRCARSLAHRVSLPRLVRRRPNALRSASMMGLMLPARRRSPRARTGQASRRQLRHWQARLPSVRRPVQREWTRLQASAFLARNTTCCGVAV